MSLSNFLKVQYNYILAATIQFWGDGTVQARVY